jgi:hypothetical protein
MVTEEDIAGIVDVLGAATLAEITAVVREIEFMEGETPTPAEEVEKTCERAKTRHWLESIGTGEIMGMEPDDAEYFIPGPDAFPGYAPKLSEVLDILGLEKREPDRERVIRKFSRRLKMRVTWLSNRIGEQPADSETLKKLGEHYDDLLNLFYDYDSWIPGAFSALEEEVLALGSRLENLREG